MRGQDVARACAVEGGWREDALERELAKVECAIAVVLLRQRRGDAIWCWSHKTPVAAASRMCAWHMRKGAGTGAGFRVCIHTSGNGL